MTVEKPPSSLTNLQPWVDLALRPHLKLLPELQVDVVHLRDGNVVVLSLLLVQQLVPERDKNSISFFIFSS